MGVQAVDYRVSTLVVLCKDCSQDVGLYPARHKCLPVDRPAMPSLPTKYQKSSQQHPSSLELNSRTMSSASTSSNTSSSPSPSFSSVDQPSSKWSSRLGKSSVTTPDDQREGEESIYFNNFASNLPEDQPSGKKLWGKIKQNDKWKQLSEKNDKPKQSGKLWGKLMQATQTMADKIPSRDDRGAESDEDDWEGETHVSRILREYYEKKQMRLPEWLFDDDTRMTSRKQSSRRAEQRHDDYVPPVDDNNTPIRTPSRRRLWEQNPEDSKKMSSRERERQELRQAPPPARAPSSRDDRYSHEDRYSNRSEDRYNHRDYARDDRYSHEDRYKENRGYRDDHYSSRRDDHYRDQDHGNRSRDRYNDRYDDKMRRDDYGDPRYDRQPPSSRRYDDGPADDYYKQRPRSPPRRPQSPPRQPQYSKSTDRPRYYLDDHPPARSERSARGFEREPPPSSRSRNDNSYKDRGNDLDDYYYSGVPDRRERAQPPSSGRRYGNDPSYF